MSKLLKIVATRHRSHIAALMTPENGYDQTKHHSGADLHKAGVISKEQGIDLDGCTDDLSATGDKLAHALQGVQAGRIDKSKANDDDFLRELMEGAGVENGDLDDADSDDGDDDGDDSDGDIRDADDIKAPAAPRGKKATV